MEHCIFDLGIINYHPVITWWTVPVAFFFLVVLAGIVFNIGRKSNLIVFILAMLLPVTTVFIFMLLGGKINIC
ncbi:hypothetical protein [Escherichia coli]|uniref:hypothetical protein n=1 Tax=Escherichia coli TaxID=562 RepID=UPI0027DCF217|nr:hypothetical protein [Escherichia coli]